jgi:molybdopterin biosynthesis enzyme
MMACIRSANGPVPKWNSLSQRIAAGHPPRALLPGTAAIFTGRNASGADTVVMQEDCEETGHSVMIAAS